jgi:CO/xanthine dehydrogenase Mo-binding subunit
MAQVRHGGWDTNRLVNSGGTGGSNAMQNTGPRVRAAAVSARNALLNLASKDFGVPVSSLSVKDGVVSGGGRTKTYGELVAGKLLNATLNPPTLNPGQAPAKAVANYKIVTTRVPRVELPAKVTGDHTYVHHIRLPGMLHGRVVRPRGQSPYGTNAKIVSVDASSVKHLGVQIVQKQNFLGVVAETEYAVIQAASQLKVKWEEQPLFPGSGNMWGRMREQDTAGKVAARYTQNIGNVDTALKSAAQTVTGTYAIHYQGHMPIGPCCAVADVTPTKVTMYSSSQAIEGIVTSIASLLARPTAQVQAFFYEGASSFGPGNRYVDTAMAAALLSEQVGKPVRLQLMRWDEHGWNAHGPAQLMDVRGGIDANGKIVAYDFTTIAQPGAGQQLTDELLGATYPAAGTVGVSTPNAGPMYNVANRRLTGKAVPLYEGYFHTGALRDPAAPQTTFASEQMIDELAYLAKMDPIEFRRKNIDPNVNEGERWLTAMNAAVQAANWQPRVANSVKQTGNVVNGRGFAFARHGTAAYATAVVDISVDKKTGKITVNHLYNGLDAGLVVNPELVENQMIGASIQGLSRALHEAVGFSKTNQTTNDWVTYPILRFADAPKVTNALVQRLDKVPIGVGEPSTSTLTGAVANAFFDATGVRIREAPMTPSRVRAVLAAAGK